MKFSAILGCSRISSPTLPPLSGYDYLMELAHRASVVHMLLGEDVRSAVIRRVPDVVHDICTSTHSREGNQSVASKGLSNFEHTVREFYLSIAYSLTVVVHFVGSLTTRYLKTPVCEARFRKRAKLRRV